MWPSCAVNSAILCLVRVACAMSQEPGAAASIGYEGASVLQLQDTVTRMLLY